MLHKEMTINELQAHVKEIDHKPGYKMQVMLKLVEEIGELAVEVRKESIEGLTDDLKQKIKYELYDIIHYVNHMANIYGINLEESIIEKSKINEVKYMRKEEKR